MIYYAIFAYKKLCSLDNTLLLQYPDKYHMQRYIYNTV